MQDFDLATAAHRIAEGTFGVDLSPDWNVGPIPNGGYLLSVVTRAMGASTQKPHPLSVTAQYLRPAANGPGRVKVDVFKRGRQVDFVTASLVQDGAERLRATGLFGDLARPGGELTACAPPELPDPSECSSRAPNPKAPTIAERFDFALHPTDAGMFTGAPTGTALLRGWMRFRDGRAPDIWSLPTFADAFPPPVFQIHPTFDWVPTLELGIHWRRVPAPGWLACAFTTRSMAAGDLEEDGQLWDSQGRIVAVSRQLAHLRVS